MRRLVATSVALTALLVGGCEPAAPKTSPVFPATTSPAATAISPPTVASGTISVSNPCQLLTLADVRKAYPAASPALGPIDPPEAFPESVTCVYTTGLPVGSQGPAAVGVLVRRDDDAAWARDMTDTINSGLATPVPGLADAIISANASSGSVHRGPWRVVISFVSPSGDPAVMTLFLGIVASRL